MDDRLCVRISVVYQNGQTGTLVVWISDYAQGQRILDQLNAADEFVQIGKPEQAGSFRLKKALIVSANLGAYRE